MLNVRGGGRLDYARHSQGLVEREKRKNCRAFRALSRVSSSSFHLRVAASPCLADICFHPCPSVAGLRFSRKASLARLTSG
jgi:hypothetical protein